MIRKRFFLIVFIGIFVIGGLFCFFWWYQSTKPLTQESGVVRVLITKGLDAQGIGELLYKNKLIRNPLAFKIYVQLFGKSKNIQAGEFEIASNLSLAQVINELSKKPLEIWVTIPEGLRREEMPKFFIKNFELNDEQAVNFTKEFLDETKGKEGYLFPDTYLFSRFTPVKLIVKKMLDNFNQKFDAEIKGKITSDKYASDDIVILASIIERETKTDEERPIVAGIFYNRLKIGIALQADATVQYAVANERCKLELENCVWWPILTLENLDINSAYNSYKYSGLPPSPIANPGSSSLKAAAFPDNMDYLYYIHDPEGIIHYAKTLAEHNENVRKYLGK